jgi:hypothetical protein
MNMESEVEVLDTPIGKEILACLLLKTGKELADLLEKYSLQDFVEERYDLYVDTLTDIYTGDDYHNGNISPTGAEEIARADAFRDL